VRERKQRTHLATKPEQKDVVIRIPLQNLTQILRILLRQLVQFLLTRLGFKGRETHRSRGEAAELGWFSRAEEGV